MQLTDRIMYYQLENSECKEDILAANNTSFSEELFGSRESHTQGRNLSILSLFSQEPNVEVTFQGLKRKLGWHQEILSRTLKRLEKDEILLKTSNGTYKLNLKRKNLPETKNREFQEEAMRITQILLPQDLNPKTLVLKLKNTWFGSWRWYGFTEKDTENVLTWLLEDGTLWVNLRISGNIMFIEAGPARSSKKDKCIRAGYELLNNIISKSIFSTHNGIHQHN